MRITRRRLTIPLAVLTLFTLYILFRTYSSGVAPLSYHDDGLLHWTKRREQHPVSNWILPPRGAAQKVPRLQYQFELHPETAEEKQIRETRRDVVRSSFVRVWEAGHKQHDAVGSPLDPPGQGSTMIDVLDALWIMGRKDEFERCVDAVAEMDLTTITTETLNLSDTTTRHLGGLLSAYDLSDRRDKTLLRKAKEVGEILYSAFDTPNRMPVTRMAWSEWAAGSPLEASTSTLLSELGSLGLEFTRLTQLTGDRRYYDAIARIAEHLESSQNRTLVPGLWPTVINALDFSVSSNHFTLESPYSLLTKEYILLGARNMQYRRMYEKAISGARQHLLFKPLTSTNEDILFIGNAVYDTTQQKTVLDPEVQGSTCTMAGILALSAKLFSRSPEELNLARKLLDGCIWAHKSIPSASTPESFSLIPCPRPESEDECRWSEARWYESIASQSHLNAAADEEIKNLTTLERGKHLAAKHALPPGFTSLSSSANPFQPATFESLFILYRITGDPALPNTAWELFQAIERAIASAGNDDVDGNFVEAMKYLYLLFSEPSVMNLDRWLFTSAGKAFKRPTGIPTYFGANG